MAVKAGKTLHTNRRKFLAGTAAMAGASAFPMPSIAQAAPIKIGVLTVKTGPLAAGGLRRQDFVATADREARLLQNSRADAVGRPDAQARRD